MFGWLFRRNRARIQSPRWVVLDVETSGLDPARDQLLSIGAVALVAQGASYRVQPADSFEVVVRPKSASHKDNILVHGIGRQAQLQATEPRQALMHFFDYVGTSPLLAFHAPFDRGFVLRAARRCSLKVPGNPWLDLAQLAPVLALKAGLKSLDEWLGHYGIAVTERHCAVADAYATALLALRLLPQAHAAGYKTFSDLQALTRQGRWMRG